MNDCSYFCTQKGKVFFIDFYAFGEKLGNYVPILFLLIKLLFENEIMMVRFY